MRSTSKLKCSYAKKKKVVCVPESYSFSVAYKLESIGLNTATKNKIYTIRCEDGNRIFHSRLTAKELIKQTTILRQLKKTIIIDLIVEAQTEK